MNVQSRVRRGREVGAGGRTSICKQRRRVPPPSAILELIMLSIRKMARQMGRTWLAGYHIECCAQWRDDWLDDKVRGIRDGIPASYASCFMPWVWC
jgi:hypothetical protein